MEAHCKKETAAHSIGMGVGVRGCRYKTNKLWFQTIRSLRGLEPRKSEEVSKASILAWKILWTEELGGQQSMGLQRVGHD